MQMKASYEGYSWLINEFYKKVVKTHRNKWQLIEKLNKMNEDACKNIENSPFMSKPKINADESGSVSGISKSNKSYRTVKQINLKSVDAEYLYLSPDFKKVLSYAFLHSIIQKQVHQVFNMLETKVKLFMNIKQKLPYQEKYQLEKAYHDWKKITQLPTHKDRVRWQKILGDSINRFPQNFMNILLKSILSTSTNSNLEIQPTKDSFERVSTQLKYSIIYLEYEQKKLIKKMEIGVYQQHLILVNLISDGQFAIFDKIPETTVANSNEASFSPVVTPSNKSPTSLSSKFKNLNFNRPIKDKKNPQTNGEPKNQRSFNCSIDSFDRSPKSKSPMRRTADLRKQALKMVQSIRKEYTSGLTRINALKILQDEDSKDARIRKILSGRKV